MSERKPTKEKIEEEEQNNNVQLKKIDNKSIFKQDFYVEPPEDIIEEDTDIERKEAFNDAMKKIKSIIPDYFNSSTSKKKKKKLKQMQQLSQQNIEINTQFVQKQQQQKNEKDGREN